MLLQKQVLIYQRKGLGYEEKTRFLKLKKEAWIAMLKLLVSPLKMLITEPKRQGDKASRSFLV